MSRARYQSPRCHACSSVAVGTEVSKTHSSPSTPCGGEGSHTRTTHTTSGRNSLAGWCCGGSKRKQPKLITTCATRACDCLVASRCSSCSPWACQPRTTSNRRCGFGSPSFPARRGGGDRGGTGASACSSSRSTQGSCAARTTKSHCCCRQSHRNENMSL